MLSCYFEGFAGLQKGEFTEDSRGPRRCRARQRRRPAGGNPKGNGESGAQQTMSQISSSALLGETRPASARPMRPARLGSMQGLLLFVPSGAAGIHRCILSKSEDGRSRRDATRKTALVDSRNPKRPRNPLPDHGFVATCEESTSRP